MKVGLAALVEKLEKEGVDCSYCIDSEPYNVGLRVPSVQFEINPGAIVGNSHGGNPEEVVEELCEKIDCRISFLEEWMVTLGMELAASQKLRGMLNYAIREEDVRRVYDAFVKCGSFDTQGIYCEFFDIPSQKLEAILQGLEADGIIKMDGEYPSGWDWVLVIPKPQAKELKIEGRP